MVEFTKHFWTDTVYQEGLCVQSGNIITAMPNGTVEFAVALATMLDVLPADKAEGAKRYYKGELP